MRPPYGRNRFTNEEYNEIADRACTILLEHLAGLYIWGITRDEWKRKYEIVVENGRGTVLATNHSHCR